MMLSELLKRLGEIYAERGDVEACITINKFAGEEDAPIIIASVHDVWFEFGEANVGRRNEPVDNN